MQARRLDRRHPVVGGAGHEAFGGDARHEALGAATRHEALGAAARHEAACGTAAGHQAACTRGTAVQQVGAQTVRRLIALLRALREQLVHHRRQGCRHPRIAPVQLRRHLRQHRMQERQALLLDARRLTRKQPVQHRAEPVVVGPIVDHPAHPPGLLRRAERQRVAELGGRSKVGPGVALQHRVAKVDQPDAPALDVQQQHRGPQPAMEHARRMHPFEQGGRRQRKADHAGNVASPGRRRSVERAPGQAHLHQLAQHRVVMQQPRHAAHRAQQRQRLRLGAQRRQRRSAAAPGTDAGDDARLLLGTPGVVAAIEEVARQSILNQSMRTRLPGVITGCTLAREAQVSIWRCSGR